MLNEIQALLNPSCGICTDMDLYYRADPQSVRFDFEKKILYIEEDSIVTTDTYFNLFSYSKWEKYTDVTSVDLELEIEGNATISFVKSALSDGKIVDSIVDSKLVSAQDRKKVRLHFEFALEQNDGIAYLKIMAGPGGALFYGGSYLADDVVQLTSVHIALVICTYKREKYVYNNLHLLKKMSKEDKGDIRFEVYIVDNGHTLEETDFDGTTFHLLRNKNAGGASGFTRGIITALERHDFTHIILMDDDALMDPEVVKRTYTFLQRIKPQYKNHFIGGATLRLDQKNLQLESGAIWNNNVLINLKRGLNFSNRIDLLLNDREESISYNSWVFCGIPCSAISLEDLPLPLFVRGDDMEYGMRHRNGIIALNGIGLWHAPVDGRYSFSMNYYMLRNQLVLNALYDKDFDAKKAAKMLMNKVLREIAYFRYENIELFLCAYKDFLQGVDFFLLHDGEALHKEIMQLCPKMYDFNELEKMGYPFSYFKLSITMGEGESLGWKKVARKLLCNGYLVPQFLKRRGPLENYAVVDLFYARTNNFYRRDCVLQIDSFGKKGVITRRSMKKALYGLCRTFALCHQMCVGAFDRAVASYQKDSNKLTNVKFWKHYLEILED